MIQSCIDSEKDLPSKEGIRAEREESAHKKYLLNYNSSWKEKMTEILIDISNSEVQRILENRRKFENEKRDLEMMSTKYFAVESDKIGEKVSKDIVDSLVHKVCDEILDSNLIAKLINLEMKE